MANRNVLNQIEYRDTGVILQVRPRINSNQAVSLEISQEVSRVDNPGTPANPNLNPTFTKRKITSRVNVQSGQTVVLGGLIQDQENRSPISCTAARRDSGCRQSVRYHQQHQ